MRQDKVKTLKSARFPIFADQHSSAKMCGSGTRDGITNEITVAHARPGGGLQVRTEEDELHHRSDYSIARLELEHRLADEPDDLPTSHSDAGRTLAWRARDRVRRQRAATAAHEEVRIRVQGNPEAFCLLRSGNRWVAVRTRGSQTLTIFAEDTDPSTLPLTPVRDPPSELPQTTLAVGLPSSPVF